MTRNLGSLAEGVADVVVVGAGIYGATIAREAALRGLDVRLVERDDFGAATSANSHHIIHGGIRYFQHGDLPRVVESIRERHALSAIAPHLVRPLPVVIPTYGHGLKSREVMTLALGLHRAVERLTGHRRRLVVPDLPPGPLSRERVRELLPGLPESGLTGGVLLYDSQVENSERLLLGILRSAVDAGARIANHLEVEDVIREGDRVAGVRARDRLGGAEIEVRGRVVVNAAGPWIGRVLARAGAAWPAPRFARALNLVVRELFPRVAAGLYGTRVHRDAAEIVARGQRLYFLAPWRGRTILGTAYAPHAGEPSDWILRRGEVEALLAEINAAYPPARLDVGDVALVHRGLLPAGERVVVGGEPEIRKHFAIRDHERDGAPGLLSVVGVKYTTARDGAVRVVDLRFERRGARPPRSTPAVTPLPGGDVGDDAEAFRRRELERAPSHLDREGLARVLRNHGAGYGEVLCHLEPGEDAPAVAMLRAEVRHGVREEMAMTLADLVFRRTDLASAGHPGGEALATAARLAAAELGWSAERTAAEIAAVEERYVIQP